MLTREPADAAPRPSSCRANHVRVRYLVSDPRRCRSGPAPGGLSLRCSNESARRSRARVVAAVRSQTGRRLTSVSPAAARHRDAPGRGARGAFCAGGWPRARRRRPRVFQGISGHRQLRRGWRRSATRRGHRHDQLQWRAGQHRAAGCGARCSVPVLGGARAPRHLHGRGHVSRRSDCYGEGLQAHVASRDRVGQLLGRVGQPRSRADDLPR
jgi:hypothetical protein